MRWPNQSNNDCSSLLCATLVRKNIPKIKHDASNEVNHNKDDFWDTVDVAQEDNVVILDAVATNHDITVTYRHPKVIQDNKKNTLSNQDLIALSKDMSVVGTHRLGQVHNLLILHE